MTRQLRGIVTGSIKDSGTASSLDPWNDIALPSNPNAMHVTIGPSGSDLDDTVQSNQCALGADQEAPPHPQLRELSKARVHCDQRMLTDEPLCDLFAHGWE